VAGQGNKELVSVDQGWLVTLPFLIEKMEYGNYLRLRTIIAISWLT
jgi:hypothetical protein